MPRKKQPPRPIPVTSPDGIGAWVVRYLESMQVRQYADNTVRRHRDDLRGFVEWCIARSVARPEQVSRAVLEAYQRHLFHQRKRNGQPLHVRTQLGRLIALRSLFKWLTRQNVLLFNPAADLELPREGRPLPKNILTPTEVSAVLDQTDTGTALGLRDRALMEVLYSTGIRRFECAALDMYDVDFGGRTVQIRRGKGNKGRVVPVGNRALLWLGKYLEVRDELLVSTPELELGLFLTVAGERISDDHLSTVVGEYIREADLGKTGAAHQLRHSCATHMLLGGADIRYVQEMLGHADIKSTTIYTRVAIAELQKVHEKRHPSGG